MPEPQKAEKEGRVEAHLFWTVLAQRDVYRASRETAIARIEAESSRVKGPDGALTGYVIDADTWREIRALLRVEPREPPSHPPSVNPTEESADG